jgi:hypothetical protein
MDERPEMTESPMISWSFDRFRIDPASTLGELHSTLALNVSVPYSFLNFS